MNLATKERINIKGLVEEPAPQTDLIFDPGKEITRASWQKMLSQLSELMESDESGRYFPGMFMHMFYLASQVRSLPEIGKDSDTVNKIILISPIRLYHCAFCSPTKLSKLGNSQALTKVNNKYKV